MSGFPLILGAAAMGIQQAETRFPESVFLVLPFVSNSPNCGHDNPGSPAHVEQPEGDKAQMLSWKVEGQTWLPAVLPLSAAPHWMCHSEGLVRTKFYDV